MGAGVVFLLLLAFILLWAVTFYFLPKSRLLRLAICLSFVVTLTQAWTAFDQAMIAAVIAAPLIVLDWAATRVPR